jgi:hypothetical protein
MQMVLFKVKPLLTITKQELCNAMSRNTRWLKKNIFDDKELLDKLGITIDDFKSIREFNFKQTKVLIEYLDIQVEDLD